ncbi:hypothetical protein GBA63_03680 [Rubrobacter tropicus]|uniref:Uncharacterized protein n=1 Tax=Rubrobacter tropicus TaxID=2653851 RepID=A0A6G8Q5V6_9ACTN|nr:hypothetical protein [Rubrobacter tropicus]QIN81840.1 hypothetical protein GBA63_03680 [Rubrobacter tropicus]
MEEAVESLAARGLPGTPSGTWRSWDNVAARIARDVEEPAMPARSDHLVMVNVGRPYRMKERLDGLPPQLRPQASLQTTMLTS